MKPTNNNATDTTTSPSTTWPRANIARAIGGRTPTAIAGEGLERGMCINESPAASSVAQGARSRPPISVISGDGDANADGRGTQADPDDDAQRAFPEARDVESLELLHFRVQRQSVHWSFSLLVGGCEGIR